MFQSRKLWQWVFVIALLAAMTAAFRAAMEADGEGVITPGTIRFLVVSGAASLMALLVRFLQGVAEWEHLGEVFPDHRLGRGWKDRLKRFFTSFDPLD